MRIKQITTTNVRIPYAAPVGPYIGRRSVGGHGDIQPCGSEIYHICIQKGYHY